MGDQGDPPNRQSLRRRRFTEIKSDPANRRRKALPNVPVLVSADDHESIDGELRRRCQVILEQVAEINGILGESSVPADYAQDCRDRLVGVSRMTGEILESVTNDSRSPGSMSAWLLRLKRNGRSIGETH